MVEVVLNVSFTLQFPDRDNIIVRQDSIESALAAKFDDLVNVQLNYVNIEHTSDKE